MMISYAQNYEDVLLNRLFDENHKGFYIDIGASHPLKLSVTKHFYDKGWTGINVDPLRNAIDLFNKYRPKDLNINCAVSKFVGEVEFFEVINYPELSGTIDVIKEKHEEGGGKILNYKVATMTANEIFSRIDGRTVDFLKIDVEGSELDVVESLNLNLHRPKVILLEVVSPNKVFEGWDNIEEFSCSKAASLINESGYLYAYFDGLNAFLIREEDANLVHRLKVGPCHIDNFIPNIYREQIIDLQMNAEKRLADIEKLTNWLKVSEEDRANRLTVIERLNERLKFQKKT